MEFRTGKGSTRFSSASWTQAGMRTDSGRSAAPFEHGHDRRFRNSNRGRHNDGENRDRAVWGEEALAEHPSTKIQDPENLQDPNSRMFVTWSLDLEASLDLGSWCLGLS